MLNYSITLTIVCMRIFCSCIWCVPNALMHANGATSTVLFSQERQHNTTHCTLMKCRFVRGNNYNQNEFHIQKFIKWLIIFGTYKNILLATWIEIFWSHVIVKLCLGIFLLIISQHSCYSNLLPKMPDCCHSRSFH